MDQTRWLYSLGLSAVSAHLIFYPMYLPIIPAFFPFWLSCFLWVTGCALLLICLMQNRCRLAPSGLVPYLSALIIAFISEIVSFYWMPQNRIALGIVVLGIILSWSAICRIHGDTRCWVYCATAVVVAVIGMPMYLEFREVQVPLVTRIQEMQLSRFAYFVLVCVMLSYALTRQTIKQSGSVLASIFVGFSIHSPVAKYICDEGLLREQFGDYANGDSSMIYLWFISLAFVPTSIYVIIGAVLYRLHELRRSNAKVLSSNLEANNH